VPVRPGFTISEATKPIVRQPPQPPPERKPAAPKKAQPAKPAPPAPKSDKSGADKPPQRRNKGKSKMSDEEVIAKLREITSPGMSADRYKDKVKIGQG